jgi:hypothetical protein
MKSFFPLTASHSFMLTLLILKIPHVVKSELGSGAGDKALGASSKFLPEALD